MCSRYADRNPRVKWINTAKGTQIYDGAVQQALLRDPDEIGIYIFNRWSSYAICEVVENMLAALNKALELTTDYVNAWAHTEGLGRFLQSDSMAPSASASDAGRPPVGGSLNLVHAYETAPPLVGILAVDLFRAHEDGGVRRDWSKYNLTKEIGAYRRHQMLKVGMRGPEDYRASTIGGKFYDLTTPRNKALVKQKLMESISEVSDVEGDIEGSSSSG
ncbi:MAG: hypothetical protein Q9207_001047 [Kuettlingeria erythrocarpa]